MPALADAPQKVCFQRGLAATVGKSGFSDVTLITGGTEALGHGIFVDEGSVESLMGLLMGKSLPGYLTHEGAMFGDRLGKEIGIFSGFYRDGLKLKAKTFRFLNAFIKNDVETYEKLMELAAELPEQFGLSVVFSGRLVWDMGEDGEVDADGPMPEGALRGMPSIRFSSVESADFVKAPAANPGGLFAKPALEGDLMIGDKALIDLGDLTKRLAGVDESPLGMKDKNLSDSETVTASINGQTVTATLNAADLVNADSVIAAAGSVNAVFTQDSFAAVRSELAAVKEQLAARDAEFAKAKADHAAELAAKDAKIAEIEVFDMRKAGVRAEAAPAANVTAAKTFATHDEKWAHYGELQKTDALLAQAFYDKELKFTRR
jgi:hypothetical protein